MKKKKHALLLAMTVLFGISILNAAEIKGKVTLLPSGKPFTKGAVLFRSPADEKYVKADIDSEGNYIITGLSPGTYIIKIDLYGLTPIEQEIYIDTKETVLQLDLPISLSILDKSLVFFQEADDAVWFPVMIFLLLGTGVILTIVCRLIQVRRLLLSLKMVLRGALHKDKPGKEEGDISPYAALMTALAATVGNGNIAGVATAIATGGPGAPVWMWIAGFLGMATKYAEGFFGVNFRVKNEKGEMSGGPMYYARHGIKNQPFAKFMGMFFAICGTFACLLGTGNMAQSNSMALAFNVQFNLPFWLSGLILTTFVGAVILGGIKRIGGVSERLVPTMIFFYFGGAIVVILANVTHLPEAFAVIFKSAFSLKAVGGAMVGTSIKNAIITGVRRGLLSNESGLAQRQLPNPHPSRPILQKTVSSP